jgi:hypothetical protein
LSLRAAILFFLSKDGRLNFSELFELARVIVRFDQVASYFQTAGQFLKRREVEQSLAFPGTCSRRFRRRSMKGCVFCSRC